MNVEMRVDEFKTYTLHNVTYNSQDNKRTYFKDNDSGELFKVTTSAIVRMYEDEDENVAIIDLSHLKNKKDVTLIVKLPQKDIYYRGIYGDYSISVNSEYYNILRNPMCATVNFELHNVLSITDKDVDNK